MKYLIITNKGEIKEQALTMIGLSTKRQSTTKIGRFGSGNKYALAFLLRNNVEFYIYSGTNLIPISTTKESFNEMDYETIHVNGKPTSLTTEMGPDWVMWFAIREIYCNALDEGDTTITVFDTSILGEFTHNPQEGKTTYIINIDDKFDMDKWDSYFAEMREPIATGVDIGGQGFSIYHRIDKTATIYKKGIRCVAVDATYQSLYDYDFDGIQINESRVVEYNHYIYEYVARALTMISDHSIIENILANCKNGKLIEAEALDRSVFTFAPGTPWANAISSKKLMVEEVSGRYVERDDFSQFYQIPHVICKKIRNVLPDIRILGMDTIVGNDLGKIMVAEEEVPKRLLFLVNQCVQEMKDHWKYNVNYPIIYFDQPFTDESHLKMAEANIKDNVIMLNVALQKFGKKEIAMALIEECEHIESKAGDETRSFQNQLIRTLVFVMENNSGFFM